jgi:tight adherence protein C
MEKGVPMQIVIMVLACLSVALLLLEVLTRRQSQRNRSKIKQRMLPALTPNHSTAVKTAPPGKADNILKSLPIIGRQIKAQEQQRFNSSCEAELPRMLEILALGMQSGLSFDAAMALYVRRFNTPLAGFCLEQFDVWERGLISREVGLHNLAAKLELPLFGRFVSTAIRALNYGAPMAPMLKDYAIEARKIYRDKQRELVAKAPVKMLIPTGALILPAMLMLVIGPILLDLTERMV